LDIILYFINSKEDLERFERLNKMSDFILCQEKSTTNLLCFKGPDISHFKFVYINKKFYNLEGMRA